MRRTVVWGAVLGAAAMPALAQIESLPASAQFLLTPGAFEELCFELEAGHGVRYQFDATAPLDFNLHWHRGNEVLFPIRSMNVQRRGGVFRSDHKEAYCLMWTNRTKQPADLRVRADPVE